MSAPFRVVHVGCGGMAGAWLGPAANLTDYKVVGLADINLDAAAGRRNEFAPDAEISTDAAEMIARLRPDVVFNCTIPQAHYAISLAGLRAGAHVLSEKPLANSLMEAREIVEEAKEQGRLFAVTQNYRYTAGPQAIRKVLEGGTLGDITMATCDFFIGAHFGGFRDEMEHVLLLDMSIHHFDLARLFTEGTPASVSCHEWNPHGSWYRHGAAAAAHFVFKGGVVFNYRGSWCAEGANTDWSGAWRIVGTKGTLTWHGDELVQEVVIEDEGFRRKTSKEVIPIPQLAPEATRHAAVISEFAECIRVGREPRTGGADNLQSLAMVFGAIESASTGKSLEFSF